MMRVPTICSLQASSRHYAKAQYVQFRPEITRSLASVATSGFRSYDHRVIIVGCGAAGSNVAHRLLRSGGFRPGEIALIDPTDWHDYQPGWTLAAAGLKRKEAFRKPMSSLISPDLKLYKGRVNTFAPEKDRLILGDGTIMNYQQLVVAPGIKVDYDAIPGLSAALSDPRSGVVSTYDYELCDKVWPAVQGLHRGTAIFTHPAGVVKCAGAPQKIMWQAWDYWKQQGRYSTTSTSDIKIEFTTALPAMFGVPKYADVLDRLRLQRGIQGSFQHDLVSVDDGQVATFACGDASPVQKKFDLLHVVPKMRPHDFVKNSPLSNSAGFVDVDNETMQHAKFHNVWSIGDASSLPTSKTAAAITGQAPVLVSNILQAMSDSDLDPVAKYDGYTSCPLLVGEKKVLLAEFKYDGEVDETFGRMLGLDQSTPRRAFYHLKKDFFPRVYFGSMVKGTWDGRRGWSLSKPRLPENLNLSESVDAPGP